MPAPVRDGIEGGGELAGAVSNEEPVLAAQSSQVAADGEAPLGELRRDGLVDDRHAHSWQAVRGQSGDLIKSYGAYSEDVSVA
jgi:hypothetical protein